MDNIKKSNLKESIEHTSMFFSIIQDYYNKMDAGTLTDHEMKTMIKFMKDNHNSNKRNLELIGISFDDTGKIRSLNEQIRILESKLGNNEQLNPENISSYISNLESSLKNDMSTKYGLDVSFSVSMGSCLSIKIKHISASLPLKKSKLNYYRNEEEFNIDKIKKDKSHYIIKNSGVDFSDEGDLYFTENNVKYFENAITTLLSSFGDISNIEHNVVFFQSKANKGAKEMYIIRNSNLSILTLPSHLAFKQTFSNR